ncbi:MAG: OmpA family protein [Spirochaetia bacterium]|nr:OmpA family protein [Spirochaetia bacterium]
MPLKFSQKIFFVIILFVSFFISFEIRAEEKKNGAEFNSEINLINLKEPVNTPESEMSPALSPDGGYMIFNSKRGKKYQDLYISHNKNGKWSRPEELKELNSAYNDETPFISSDGNILLFSSDRDGSLEMPKDDKGQIRVSYDIYMSLNIDGKWQKPIPLPGNVNSIYHEKAPTLSLDNTILFFNQMVFGRQEINRLVFSEFKNNAFQKPALMPKPFNAGFSDRALIQSETGDGFYFSSMRPDSLGGWDIYYVPFKNGDFGAPENLGGVINSKENEIYLSRIDQRYYLSSNREGGRGLFDIYSFYLFQKEKDFQTRAIYFDYNSAKIKLESYDYLNALVSFMKNNSNLKLKILGHTDLHGSLNFNDNLSLQRAEAVKNYLIKNGITAERLQTEGKGKRNPVILKMGENYDALNRRTEFQIIK